jgi:predicted HicB family RNase H-like nuclease
MNTMTYKGYTAKVEYSEEDGCFVGHLIGLRDIVGFDGASVRELKSRFHKAVEHYLWASDQLGQAPEKPYSGRIMVRVAPDLHAKATVAAKTAGKSLNQWVSQALERAIEAR